MNVKSIKKLKIDFYKQGNKNYVSALNAVLSEIEIIESRQNKNLDELEICSVIKKTISMFDEQSEMFLNVGRDPVEFVDKANYLKTLIPTQLSDNQISDVVNESIVELKASSIKDMGKVMSFLKDKYGSSLDMKIASSKVRETLQNF